jgi:regulator of protease activity HflC (stomatin/prohibitin superfamily)
MSLGPDKTICRDEYIEAMRQRLIAEDPALAENLENEGVKANFGALAEALFQVLTARAETLSTAAADPAFWQWVASMIVWAQAMTAWQAGVRQAFQNWAAAGPNVAFKNAVLALSSPGAPPAAPASLKGKII